MFILLAKFICEQQPKQASKAFLELLPETLSILLLIGAPRGTGGGEVLHNTCILAFKHYFQV